MEGWIKLYRKLLNHEVFKSKDDKLFKTFIYCLLRANHKETKIYFNKQTVNLKAGQFITSRNRAARDLGYSPKTFDRKIDVLQKDQILTRNLTYQGRDERDPLNGTKMTHQMTHNMTHRFSIISIINWGTYQARPEEDDPPNDPQHDPERDPLNGTKMTPDKKYKEGKKKDPGAISSEISSLAEKLFPGNQGKELFHQIREAIASTREGGRVSDSVILAELKKWSKLPATQVQAGIRIYLEKGYHLQKKKEEYLWGIIQNQKPGETERPQGFQSTGSPLLDSYYRKGGQA